MTGVPQRDRRPRHMPHRGWMLDRPPGHRHVALRPRRCPSCDAPVLLDLDDTVLDNTGRKAHRHAR